MKNRNKFLAIATSVALLFTIALVFAVAPRQEVAADAVTNYWTFPMDLGATPIITTGGQTAAHRLDNSDEGYQPGQIVIHVDADASNTTSTLTIYPQYSNETLNCADVTSWFTGTDYIPFSTDAVGALSQVVGAEIATTVNSTASLALTSVGSTTITGAMPYVITSTYAYGSPTTYTVQAANAAGSGYNSVVQSLAVTGDTVAGRDFVVYGRCLRLNYTVSFGTITPTVWIQKRDFYE